MLVSQITSPHLDAARSLRETAGLAPSPSMSARGLGLIATPTANALPVPPRRRNRNKKTPQDVFDEMRRNFSPSKAKGVKLTYAWKISGPNGGSWYVKINNGTCEIGKGAVAGADVTFRCSDQTWVALSNETLSGMRAFLTGKLKVDGSQLTARKLDELFPA
jgi:putative sterol carrier protein